MLGNILLGLKNVYYILNDIRSFKDYKNNIDEMNKIISKCITDLETHINMNYNISKLDNVEKSRGSNCSFNLVKNLDSITEENKLHPKKVEKKKSNTLDNSDRLISDLEVFNAQEPKEKIKISERLRNYFKVIDDYKKISINKNLKNNKCKIPNGNPNIKNKASICINYPENSIRLKLFSHRKPDFNLNHNNSFANNKLSNRINKINEIIKIINIDKNFAEKLKNLYGNQITDKLFRFNISDTLLNSIYNSINEIKINKYNINYSFHHKSRNKGGLINDLLLRNYNTESVKSSKNIKKQAKSRNKGVFDLSKKCSFEGNSISQYPNEIINEYLTLNSNHNCSFNK